MMISYHGNPELKAAVVAEAVEHRLADRYRKGLYWDESEQKGGSVGCMLQSGDHSLSESKWGIPRALTRLQDVIFEGLAKDRDSWTERYFGAVPVGADLSRVSWQLTHWNLTETLILRDSPNPDAQAAIVQCRSAIKQCADVIAPLTKGEPVDRAAARAAADAARAAALAAADAARAAAYAADAAAYAAYAAAYAAYAAADAAQECYEKMADKLIELLAAAPVAVPA